MNPKEFINKAFGLRSDCYNCRDCELGSIDNLDGYDPHVFAVGNVLSGIVFCAEAPGLDETKLKKPLVGRSGKLFDELILGGLGFKREDVWITNTVLCRPPNNRKPTLSEMQTCSRHLKAQLDFLKPKLVVAMGSTPMQAFIGETSGITKRAGTSVFSEKYKVDVFFLTHTSFILRTGQYDLLKSHVLKLKEYIGEKKYLE